MKIFKRKEKSNQSLFMYCPNCENELISTSSFIYEGEDIISKCACSKCGTFTEWYHGAPAPILIKVNGENYKYWN